MGQLEYPFQNAPPRRSATSGTYPLVSLVTVSLVPRCARRGFCIGYVLLYLLLARSRPVAGYRRMWLPGSAVALRPVPRLRARLPHLSAPLRSPLGHALGLAPCSEVSLPDVCKFAK